MVEWPPNSVLEDQSRSRSHGATADVGSVYGQALLLLQSLAMFIITSASFQYRLDRFWLGPHA